MASITESGSTKTTLREDLRALLQCPRELWLVYFATFLEYLGIFSFLPTLPLWLSGDFGFDDKRAGWWAATFSTLVSLLVFVVGSLADAIGVRRTLLIAFGLAAITRLAMAVAPSPMLAIASLLAFGLAYATTSPVLQTAIQRVSSKQTRAFAFTLWYVSFNLAGALCGPFIIDGTRHAFIDPATKKLVQRSFDLPLLGTHLFSANRVIMAIGFVVAIFAFVVILFLRKDFEHRGHPGEEAQAPAKKTSPLVALKGVVSDKLFWRFMVLLAFLSLVRMMFQHMHFTWPKYVLREQGDDFPVGTIWSINAMLILVLAPLGTALTRNRKPFQIVLFGAFLSSLSPFVLCFGSSMPYQLGMILVLTVGEALWSPRLVEYNVSIAPRGREATYVSLSSFPYFFAKLLVGPTSGYLLSAYCPPEGPRNAAMLWAIIGMSTLLGPTAIWFGRNWISQATPPGDDDANGGDESSKDGDLAQAAE